jgi:ADP-heptose:LPS heptosyltransferase
MTKHFAIIQLNRIGDVIQTCQAAQLLKQEHPNIKLTLIARSSMAKNLKFLTDTIFDNTVFLSPKELIQTTNALENSVNNIISLCKDIALEKIDVLINLSFCKTSSYLTTLIDATEKLGIKVNNQGQVAIEDRWSQFVYSNVMSNNLNPFNIVDIFRFIMGSTHTISNNQSLNTTKKSNTIVIHPFASNIKKQWHFYHWTEVIYQLLKNTNNVIHILSGPSEIQKSQSIKNQKILESFQDRIVINETSIEESYDITKGAALFIGNDSMVSHLAALAQIPSIILALGPVRPHETTPYQSNVITLAPRINCFPCRVDENCTLLPCHSHINHNLVINLAYNILATQEIGTDVIKNINPLYFESTHVYSPSFKNNQMYLHDISPNMLTKSDLYRDLYYLIWSFYLNEKDITLPHTKLSQNVKQALQNDLVNINHLFELYSFGMTFSKRLIEEASKGKPDTVLIQQDVNKLASLDQLCQTLKNTANYLGPLIDYFFVNKVNAKGDNIITIAENTLLSFNDASNLTATVFELIEQLTCKEHVSSHASEVKT